MQPPRAFSSGRDVALALCQSIHAQGAAAGTDRKEEEDGGDVLGDREMQHLLRSAAERYQRGDDAQGAQQIGWTASSARIIVSFRCQV